MTGPSGAGERMVGRRYRLIERVGQGGMGIVWRAHDDVLGRTVAVKEVDLPQLGDVNRAELRERTMREARAAARLSHPNAVTVYDVIEEDGRPWIIMALVQAHSLAEVLRDSGPLPPARVAQIGLDVLSALEAAHAAGILHRDVKPGNVLLGHDGRVVLTDFGIATLEGDSSLTSTGLLMGAPAYIAPERARGLPAGPGSDLWSLGATLYAALEGRPPFDRDTPMATLTALISEEPPVPRAGGPLTPVLLALLEPDPQRRIDAPAARRMLTGALTGANEQPTRTMPTPTPEPATGSRADAAWTQVIARPKRPAPDRPVARPPVIRPVAPAPPRTGRAVALITVLALAVLAAAVAGVLIAKARNSPGASATPTRPKGSASPSSSPSGRQSASPSPSPSAAPSPQASTRPSASPKASPTSAPAGSGVPTGFVRYTDPTGFSLAVPAGWRKTNEQSSGDYGQVDFADPANGGRFLRFAHTTKPTPDPVADWKQQEKAARKNLPGYQRISIQAVSYRGFPTADWNFTFGSGGARTEVLDRGFKADASHGYAIYLSAPAGQWSASLPYFRTAASTFQAA